MPQVEIDPSEVRNFASELKKFANELEQNMKTTAGKLDHLGQTWRDQEHKNFEEKFKQSVAVLKPLIGEMNEYIGFLGRKAEAVEVYLSRR